MVTGSNGHRGERPLAMVLRPAVPVTRAAFARAAPIFARSVGWCQPSNLGLRAVTRLPRRVTKRQGLRPVPQPSSDLRPSTMEVGSNAARPRWVLLSRVTVSSEATTAR